MTKETKIVLSLGGEKICELSESNGISLNYRTEPNEYEYYLHKKDTLWFRNIYGRISVDVTQDRFEGDFDGIKYGDKVIINYST